MRTSFTLGRVMGIPIGINLSWLFIFVFITSSLSLYYYPESYPKDKIGWPTGLYWGLGLITSLLFFSSLLAHELTHSIIARRSGIPVRSITLFIFGGVAHISREASRPRTELVMAMAGPASSLAIAGFFALVSWLFMDFNQPVHALGLWLARINLLLALFNMIPGFPLDGGRVFRSILWAISGNFRRSTRIATLAGQGVGYLFILAGIYLAFSGDWVNGLLLAFVGWFLENAASSSYRQSLLRDALQGLTAADVMERGCPSVPSDISLGRLVQEHILPTNSRCFMVAEAGHLQGIVALSQVKNFPRRRWESITVAQAMTPMGQMRTFRPEEAAIAVLERMQEEGLAQVPVVQGEEVVGLISRETLGQVLRTRSELGM